MSLRCNGPGTGISYTLKQSISFMEMAFGSSDPHFSDRMTTALHIMHMFTNAKMARNDDSCRATMSVKLGIHPSDEIASAHIQVFGLDTSRIVFQVAKGCCCCGEGVGVCVRPKRGQADWLSSSL